MRFRVQVLAFITGYVVAGATVLLDVSTRSPEPGQAVSLTCWRPDLHESFYERFMWTIDREASRVSNYGRLWCRFSNCDLHNECKEKLRITTCRATRQNVTIEIQRANLTLLAGSNWTCSRGDDDSNVVIFDASDPVFGMRFLNASLATLSVEEGETITLVCVATSSWKTPSIIWKLGNQTVTGNVTRERTGYIYRKTTKVTLRLTVTWKNNLQSVSCIGQQASTSVQSDQLQLIVKVPLSAVSTSMSDSVQFDAEVLCETNPTSPASRVYWMRGNTPITDNVETTTLVKDGKTVTKSVLTLGCNGGTETVYCMGQYGNKTRTSLRDVVIMCPSGGNMAPMMCYGGGAGVGVALALVILAVGSACLIYRIKHKNIQNDHDHGATNMLYITPQCEQNGRMHNDQCCPESRSYDRMNPATREVHVERRYEDLRVYEKVQ